MKSSGEARIGKGTLECPNPNGRTWGLHVELKKIDCCLASTVGFAFRHVPHTCDSEMRTIRLVVVST